MAADLWAITSFFNPVRYRRRLENYRVFRRHLSVPLIAVELAFERGFELDKSAADILIQVGHGDVLWQKERLLNLALAALPAECTALVWLDADVVFERDDWALRTLRLLEQYPLVQPFETVFELAADETAPRRERAYRTGTGLLAMIESGAAPVELLSGNRLHHNCHSGLAWAARRELLEKTRFYDACILGSGNRAMICAALGFFTEAQSYLGMNARQRDHYLSWAELHRACIRDRIGHAADGIFHLWHGALENRGYAQRHRDLQRFDFDPLNDIALASSGAWRWNSDKPALHQYVKDYFAARKEDG